jgi:hypothetical protein
MKKDEDVVVLLFGVSFSFFYLIGSHIFWYSVSLFSSFLLSIFGKSGI